MAITISGSMALHNVIKLPAMKKETLGQRIKRLRMAAGLSQAALAAQCGWRSQSRVGNYELGTREPTLADLERIAKAVGVDPSELILDEQTGLSVKEKAFEYPTDPTLRRLQTRLGDAASHGRLTPALQNALEAVLNLAQDSAATRKPRREIKHFDIHEEMPHDLVTYVDYEPMVTDLVAQLHEHDDVPEEVQQAGAIVVDFLKRRAESGR